MTSMIRQGIPKAIKWLSESMTKRKEGAALDLPMAVVCSALTLRAEFKNLRAVGL